MSKTFFDLHSCLPFVARNILKMCDDNLVIVMDPGVTAAVLTNFLRPPLTGLVL